MDIMELEMSRPGENWMGFPVELYDVRRSPKGLLSEAENLGIYIDPDFRKMLSRFQSTQNGNVATVRVPAGKVFDVPLDMYDMLAKVEEASKGKLTECPDPGKIALQEAIKYMKGGNRSRYDITWIAHNPVEVGRARVPQVAAVLCGGGRVYVVSRWAFRDDRFGPDAGLRFGFRK